ncbi:MAG TPA: SDR family NAD(P)-dependent oxidoreductase [Egibacteraceae bacterium]|nr:SDR family NAD(P)-dependent oxidoreductase [Egibacteraceae bacterium]
MRSPAQMLDLSGVAVAVTGAGGLIGAGIAARLAAAGADLVLHHLSSADACRTLAESVAETGARAVTVKADLTDRDGAQSVIDAGLSAFGKLDAVVNNAGLQPLADLLAVSAEEFRRIVDVNLVGAHLMTAALARHLIARAAPGSVVHIASIEAVQPARGHAHYSASKAAVVMHAKAAALELGPHGIRVNCVSPGVIRAPGIEQAWPEGVSRWQSAAPLERLGEPDDVGDACVFLISPLARWITGIDLVVDGGVSASPTY